MGQLNTIKQFCIFLLGLTYNTVSDMLCSVYIEFPTYPKLLKEVAECWLRCFCIEKGCGNWKGFVMEIVSEQNKHTSLCKIEGRGSPVDQENYKRKGGGGLIFLKVQI